MSEFSHLDDAGRARMVDVSHKERTHRVAVAAGVVNTTSETITLLQRGELAKGNVLAAARIAAILAAKRTADLIPLCHPLPLDHIDIDFTLSENRIEIRSRVSLTGRTGAEMEALTAVSVAALTIYDMCKAVDRRMEISNVRLIEKSGGGSGPFKRGAAEGA
jgi:cyclic pyranopterin phosphate synthase